MTETEYKEIKLIVPWGHVAARTYGSTTGERVLLVHGLQDNAGAYCRLMKYLPMSFFYYVCVDLPGHGWSSHLPSGLIIDFMDYVHALHFILEALQWKTCTYIGHSMGGHIGLMFSVFEPYRIKKIISIDAFMLKNYYKLNMNYVTYLENAFALSIKANKYIEPVSYTKEEVLHAFKTLRISILNSEAADALFERAVTEVNGKYIYNRDIRTKYNPYLYLKDQADEFNGRLTVPIYIFVPSEGWMNGSKKSFISSITLSSKTVIKVINVDGNHDIHNNNPEKIAPFICKILTSNNTSKL